MPSFVQTLTAFAAALAVASASPVDTKVGTFTVDQVENPTPIKRNGPLALAKAYRKYGVALPDNLAQIVSNATVETVVRRTTGSATTTPTEYDSEYLTPVTIGTPGTTLNLDFDTGSSDLWVFSSDLSSSSKSGHNIYTASKSSTSKKVSGSTWKISYGDGSSASGNVYTDVVTIGGVSYSAQAVETASKVSSEFVQDTNDGLVGLAFSSINTVSPKAQKTFFDNVKSSLTSPILGVDLKAGKAGHYDFGYAPSSRYTGSIAYTSVDSSQGFWTFTSSGYSVGSTSSSSSITGIADTGTTLLLLPDSVVKAYYKQVSGAKDSSTEGGYIFSCSATLPSFSFKVGSNTITIPGTYMNYAPIDSTGSQCYGGIQSNSGIGFSIFGDVALKAAYVVFDLSTPKLGWANKSL